MGTGYTRNDAANNIADGNVINASDLDGEFDAIQAAFNASTGHSHDGTTGEGPQIDTGGIADSAVTTAKINDANVTTAKIANSNVTLAKMAANSVDSDQYVDGSIDRVHLAADIVDGTKIADDSINSEHYVDGSIDTAHIGNLQVTTAKIAADAIDGTKLADDSINSEHYVDGSIDRVHLAADIIDGTKLADNAVNSEHYTDGSIDRVHLAADIIDGTKIANDVINSEHYVAGSIDAEHLASSSVTAAKVANDAVALGTKTTGNYVATITAGTGITGSSSSEGGTPTIALATAGAGAATYGSTDDGTKIDTITLDAYGRVTAVATGATMDRWILEDGDGTEVVINRDNEVKFVEGGGVDINWTDTSTGSDGDPYDLTFTINTSVTAGNGLTGGGQLNASRTLNVGAGTGIDVAADSISVDVSDFMSNGSNNRVITATGADAMNAESNLTFDGSSLNINGNINDVTDIYLEDQIFHAGDTDTYLQFHASNQFRIVTGGTEMLEVNDSYVLLGSNTVGKVETANKTGSVTPNLHVYNSFVWTLTGNITLNNPTTEGGGMSGVFIFIHSGAARTVSLGTDWETAGAAGLTLSGTSGAVDIVPYFVQATGNILLGTPQLAFA